MSYCDVLVHKKEDHRSKFSLCRFNLTFDPQIAEMMRAAGKEHLLTRLEYPDTGHLIEPPFSPHFRATNFIVNLTKEKGEFSCRSFY